uniref:Uncharacterized protein n=1 Tax=Oryza brachyantha TaxID=4533 RepID=J3N5V3_ORYBR
MDEEEGRQRRQAAAAPLLEKKTTTGEGYCIEGCSGCAVERRKAGSTGIPYGSFLFVWIVTLCTGTYLITLHGDTQILSCMHGLSRSINRASPDSLLFLGLSNLKLISTFIYLGSS